MDQFIREVDEEYRREQIAALWRRYGALIVALAVLVVAGVAGWRFYETRREQQAQAASARYEEALQLARDGKASEAESALSGLTGEGPDGYRLVARFRLAAETGRREASDGAKAFEAIAGDAAVPGTLQDLARLRAAVLRLDMAEAADEAVRGLERLAAPSNPWRHTAREMLGLSLLKRGDVEGAGKWFDQIAADRETPAGLRSRLEIYVALVAGGRVQTQ